MKNTNVENEAVDSKLINDADKKSKSMIRLGLGERPFMDYVLYNCITAGYDDIAIVINEKDDSIQKHYMDKAQNEFFNNISITYAIQKIPLGRTKPLGTADALLEALKSRTDWSGSKFTMINSDNLYSLKALKLMLQSEHQNAMIDYDREGLNVEHERVEKFAITYKNEEGFLTDIIEKPMKDEIDSVIDKWGFVGVSMNCFSFSYDMINPYLQKCPLNTLRNEKELPTAIKMMIKDYPSSLYCHYLKEEVPDLTSKQDIIRVKKYLEEKFSHINF